MSLAIIKPKKQRTTRPAWTSPLVFSPRSLALFTRQLALMYRSGIPIPRAVKALAHQVEEPSLAYVLLGILWLLKRGSSLSEALRCYPFAFGPVYLALIREGESASELGSSLDKAADMLEDEYRLRHRVKAALQYPFLVLIVGLGTGAICLRVMAPILNELTAGATAIPLPTQVLLGVATVLQSKGWLTLLFMLGLLCALWLRAKVRTPAGRRLRDLLLLQLPITGRLARGLVLCRISRTFAGAIRAGVPYTLVLELSSEVAGNEIYRESLLQARQALIDGEPLPKFFGARTHLYPTVFTTMLVAGQESGNLDLLADRLADILELEAEMGLETLMALLQPLVVGVLGLGVAFVGLATLLPIYGIL